MKERKGDFIGVYDGKKFWPLDPKPDEVDMIGVAHALSQVCRFNGHTNVFWSIAQHSILVERILTQTLGQKDNPRVRMLGLLHDTSEAYISDLLRPFKKEVTGYKEIEEAVQNSILAHCGLTPETIEEHELVKEADDIALTLEASVLMETDEHWNLKEVTDEKLISLKRDIIEQNRHFVKHLFLAMCIELMDAQGIEAPFDKFEVING